MRSLIHFVDIFSHLPVVRRFIHFIDTCNRWGAKVGTWLILGIVISGVIEVVARNVFNDPTQWAWELNQLLLCTYIVLGGGYTLLMDEHVRMDVFYEKFSPRRKAISNLVLSVLFFVFVGVLLWNLIILAGRSLGVMEHSITGWGPPLYPLKTLLPLAVLLVLLQGIATFIRNLNIVIRGEKADL